MLNNTRSHVYVSILVVFACLSSKTIAEYDVHFQLYTSVYSFLCKNYCMAFIFLYILYIVH